MTEHVLVPVDGSDCASAALEFALEAHDEDRLTALYAIDPREVLVGVAGLRGGAGERVREEAEETADQVLADARDRAADHDVDLETACVRGNPAEAILEYVEATDVDHVVMGSHGRGRVGRTLLGSVAEAVVRRATVPVTVVR